MVQLELRIWRDAAMVLEAASSGPMSRPTPGPFRPAPGALRRRQELAPGKAGRYRRRNCPGCGHAPIEAWRKADGLRFVLDDT